MPELPEVEQVRRTLSGKIEGSRIEAVEVLLPRIVRAPDTAEAFCRLAIGKEILAVERRGKYLLIRLSDEWTLVVHLRMTGRLLVRKPPGCERFARIIFTLSNGACLCYADNRTLGTMHLLPATGLGALAGLASLGPEPFDEVLTAARLSELSRGRRVAVKSLLLDQRIIAGIGNIYADESLFVAGIHPARPAGTLSLEEWAAVLAAVRQVLAQAIDHRGTSFRDYRDANGEAGSNQLYLHAYGRGGQKCGRCGAIMTRIVVGGRGTCFCPACQR